MIILAQNNDAVFDFDKFSIMSVEGTDIVLMSYAGEQLFNVGHYKSKERCKEICEDFFTKIGYVDKYEMPVI